MNNNIEKLQQEIAALRAAFNSQLDEFDRQISQLAHEKSQIEASIRYASRIQRAMLPSIEILNKNFDDFFILYKPRDVVSGDFYWMSHKQGKTIVAAADCTGHGVPGAFISMLGVSFLNQIVNEERIFCPDDILNKLRFYIVKNLQQKGLPQETHDGLDIALVTIDKQKQTLQFAGANNPVYIVRNTELIEFKGDKMPIAINNRMDPFTKTFHEFTQFGRDFLLKQDELHPFSRHTFSLNKGDAVYLFSDGYPDQFGGAKNRRFMSKNFKKLLQTIEHEPMNEQRKKLDSIHTNWKGTNEQLDDILVLGLRI